MEHDLQQRRHNCAKTAIYLFDNVAAKNADLKPKALVPYT